MCACSRIGEDLVVLRAPRAQRPAEGLSDIWPRGPQKSEEVTFFKKKSKNFALNQSGENWSKAVEFDKKMSFNQKVGPQSPAASRGT